MSHHLVDPELLPGLEMIPSFTFNAETLPMVRAGMASMPAPEVDLLGCTIERVTVPSPEGHEVLVLVYRPEGLAPGGPALLHIHGGGYVLGSAETMARTCLALASALGCLVASVDYRLAPETSHPGPVEDCYAALTWLAGQADALGIDAARIAVTGESAGGGLAAGLALLARDRSGPAICHQHLIYPMIDDRTCRESAGPHTGHFVWSPESNAFGWASLLGSEPGGEDVSPYAAAARAEDLAGLPPTFISVGALDLFLEEDLAYARRLYAAGVPTELHVWPGAYHGFDMVAGAGVTRRAQAASVAALSAAFSRR
jgi:triacylglycerol lipase